MSAFVTLKKKTLDSWIWDMPSDQTKVALTLLLMANWKDGQTFSGGQLVVVKRGQIMTSLDALAVRSRVSKQTVRTTLVNLEACEFLTCQSTNRYRIITICNYEKHQSKQLREQQAEQQATNTPINTHSNTPSTRPSTPIEQVNKRTSKQENQEAGASARSLSIAAIETLNSLTGRAFDPAAKPAMADAKKLIALGHTPEEAEAVVRAKHREWRNDEHMAKQLKPSVLLRPSNFIKYLAEDVQAGAPRRELIPTTDDGDLFAHIDNAVQQCPATS